MKRTILSGVALLASVMSFNATVAQDVSEEDAQSALNQRQGLFQVMAFSNGPLGQMARGAEFDKEAAILGTERVIMLSKMIPEVFATNTTGHDLDTRAMDAIWDNQEEFNQLAMDLTEGAEAALEILENQGEDGVRAAISEIGPKCGACHDRFRLD